MNIVTQIRPREQPGFMERALGPLRKRLCLIPILEDGGEEDGPGREESESRTVSGGSTATSSSGHAGRSSDERVEGGDNTGEGGGVNRPRGQEE